MTDDLYKMHILDHFNNPRNKAEMENPDIEEVAKNASCGDSYILYLKIEKNRILQATFSGVGCAISTAAASMLTEKVRGMDIADVMTITEGDVFAMLGITVSAARESCALLLYCALRNALERYA